MVESFLSRWSQRKQALRAGQQVPELVKKNQAQPVDGQAPEATNSVSKLPPGVTAAGVAESASDRLDATPPAPASPPAPALTLDDVQALTPQDNFARFVAPDVAPAVRNAAMKKLFADPHFNVMDGLDIYIDDYSKPSPLPEAMLQKMASAQFMKLVDAPKPPQESTEPPTPANTLHSEQSPTLEPDHDHPDLRLQPDHAAGRAGLERQPEPAPDAAQQPVPPPSC